MKITIRDLYSCSREFGIAFHDFVKPNFPAHSRTNEIDIVRQPRNSPTPPQCYLTRIQLLWELRYRW
ncbi:hypothetical protein BDZ91DRAFT_743084 [Kalaharituber pfeilii]|nr:hypothetical protein BDZ91DRAFT_743084 [Kalaharituber pfeilii]